MEEVRLVLGSQYGLSKLRISALVPNSRNAAFHIETQNSQHLYLKRFKDIDRRSEIAQAAQAATRLREEGIPIPRVIPTREGKLVCCVVDGLYALSDWISAQSSEDYDVTARQAESVGKVVAACHKIFLLEDGRLWPPSPPPDILDQIATVGKKLEESRALDDDSFLYELSSSIEAHRQIVRSRPAFHTGRLPTEFGSLIGDLSVRQFLFNRAGDVQALVDWEYLSTKGVLADDVSSCLFRSFQRNDGTLELSNFAAFISGYQENLKLSRRFWDTVVLRLHEGAQEHVLILVLRILDPRNQAAVTVNRDQLLISYRCLLWLLENISTVQHVVYRAASASP